MNEQFYIHPIFMEKLFKLASEKEMATVIYEYLNGMQGSSPEISEIISAMKSDDAYDKTFTKDEKKAIPHIIIDYTSAKMKGFLELLDEAGRDEFGED